MANVSRPRVQDYGLEYQKVRAHDWTRKKIEIEPYNMMKVVSPWEHRVLWPLCQKMHVAQVLCSPLASTRLDPCTSMPVT